MKKPKLVIMVCSIRDKHLGIAVHKHMMNFHMAKDLNLELKSHDQCEELLVEGKLPPKQFYWWPRKDGYALVIEERAKKHSDTWERMITCYSDFCNGWRAARK